MSDDGEEGTVFQVDDQDEFLLGCAKLNESEFQFLHNGMTGMYKSTTKYLKKQDAYSFTIGKKSWSSNMCPTGLPSNNVGSYMFLVDKSVFDSTKEVTHDWLRPWNSVALDGKRRVTPKWEKVLLGNGDTFLRVSKSRHPRFPWIKRQVVFASNADGAPISNIFYQYVLEEKGDITQEEYLIMNQSARSSLSHLELPVTDYSIFNLTEVTAKLNKCVQNYATAAGMIPEELEEQEMRTRRQPENNDAESTVNVSETSGNNKPPVKVLEDCLQDIQSELTSWKQRYSTANGLAEMRKISEKCEQLTVLKEETSEAVSKLAAEQYRKLRRISNADDEGPSPRKKPALDGVLIKEEE